MLWYTSLTHINVLLDGEGDAVHHRNMMQSWQSPSPSVLEQVVGSQRKAGVLMALIPESEPSRKYRLPSVSAPKGCPFFTAASSASVDVAAI